MEIVGGAMDINRSCGHQLYRYNNVVIIQSEIVKNVQTIQYKEDFL